MNVAVANINRNTIRLELSGRILADLLRLSTVLGTEAAYRALGRAAPAIPARVELTLNKLPNELSLHDIDLDQFPIGRIVMAMYDYGFEQRYPIGVQMHEFKAEIEHVEDFVLNLQSEYIGLFMHDAVYMGSAGDANWGALPSLYQSTAARLNLDMGETLSLREIAILAGMNEKSVRNALTAVGEAQLRICSFGSIELVDNDEARRWLSLRRGFVPTQFHETTAIAGDHPDAVNSLYELGGYINKRWTSLGKSPETVQIELEWSQDRFEYLNGLTANPQSIDPRDCGDLAKSLLVSESWFTTQVMRNLYPHQVEQLLMRKDGAEISVRSANVMIDNDRLCQRVRFILHDGCELFPIRMKNRETGLIAFRVSEGGTGGNTIEQTIEVTDENKMIDMVCKQEMSVRLSSADGKRQGQYRKGRRAVRTVELDGHAI